MLRWSEIENAGLAFGNKIVNINGNDYKIRLMKTFNDNNNSTKNSEWNRLMLPIIGLKGNERDIGGFYWDNNKRLDLNIFPYGRFSLSSENKIEPNDMPVFANYSWWRDFDGYYSRWMLENIPSKEYNRNMYRGMRDWDGAAGAGSEGAASTGIGWQPILESVNSNETK